MALWWRKQKQRPQEVQRFWKPFFLFVKISRCSWIQFPFVLTGADLNHPVSILKSYTETILQIFILILLSCCWATLILSLALSAGVFPIDFDSRGAAKELFWTSSMGRVGKDRIQIRGALLLFTFVLGKGWRKYNKTVFATFVHNSN